MWWKTYPLANGASSGQIGLFGDLISGSLAPKFLITLRK
jgi:hypothetical protein